MKRILLTTTSLVLAAGVAQADVTMSGSVTAGIARDGGAVTNNVVGATEDWKTYSEANLTAAASTTLDNGMTVSAAVSIDAGEGYDFADDDGFDTTGTGLRGGFDSASIDMGSMGTLTFDPNGVVQLVDADDDGSADIGYTGTFGVATVAFAMDVDKDLTDAAATADTTLEGQAAKDLAKHSDVQWSAKVSMPIGGGTAFAAMDEEGGNAFGGSFGLNGLTVSIDSKLEAAETKDALGTALKRSTTTGISYVMGATTLGATYNSRKDGDQWGVSAAYAAGNTTVNLSTDEDSDWAVSASQSLGGGVSVVGGVNYTEDAYVGMSFAF